MSLSARTSANAKLLSARIGVFLQISFAHFKKQLAMIYKPADPVWFQLFADSRSAKLRSEHQDEHYLTGGLPIPPTHVIAEMQGSFKPADA